jgi:hypothetical protein
VQKLRLLLGELVGPLEEPLPAPLQLLRRDVEVVLARPRWLKSTENQLDLIEELVEVVWDGSLLPAVTDGQAGHLGTSLEELDDLALHLCQRAERWCRALLGRRERSSPPLSDSPD